MRVESGRVQPARRFSLAAMKQRSAMTDLYQDDINWLLPVHMWRLNLANLRNKAIHSLSDLLR